MSKKTPWRAHIFPAAHVIGQRPQCPPILSIYLHSGRFGLEGAGVASGRRRFEEERVLRREARVLRGDAGEARAGAAARAAHPARLQNNTPPSVPGRLPRRETSTLGSQAPSKTQVRKTAQREVSGVHVLSEI